MWSEPKTVEAATSADRTPCWALKHRGDGFFVYSEDSFTTEDLTELGAGIMEYCTPSHFSGLLETKEDAKAGALGQLRWLKQMHSSA